MKHLAEFKTFLEGQVNLNKTRIKTLSDRVETIENFLWRGDWGPIIKRFSSQGSWAHKTIIKPPGENGFDADLLMFVNPVPGWTANDYILELRGLFLESKTYKDIVGLKNRCVTLNYAGDFELDVVPCVVERPGRIYPYEVCNRTDDRFEPTDSERYTEWFQRAKNLAGCDHLIHFMRLIKYLRDTKTTFSCKSVLLNTLVANQISQADIHFRPSYFPDLPTAFRTLISRLDHYLQDRPNLHKVTNPVLQIEDFNRHWDQDKYANFRAMIHKYRQWTDEAYRETDEKQSIKKWRWIFGDEFAKGADVLTEEVTGSLVPIPNFNVQRFTDTVQAIKLVGLSVLGLVRRDLPWVQRPPFVFSKQTIPISIKATVHVQENGSAAGSIASGQVLPADRHIRFEAVGGTGAPFAGKDHDVQWQVVNTDTSAGYAKALRGGFYTSKPRSVRWERTEFRGIHWVEAFLIRKRTGACIGRSDRFFVVIE
jgi:Second Messenger Oligonucleotide or Dinucleotide Synthetase domain/Adenylyl/Guanylyl and SMODS C-terminal sensor domain